MSTIWFCSDLHLGHKGVINFANNFRGNLLGVSTIEEHDEHIKNMLDKQIGKRDILYLLGDNGDPEMIYDILENCKAMQIRYIPGNHDTEKSIELLGTLRKVKIFPPATYKGHWVTHHPIHPRELWGRKNIHGHVHSVNLPDENYINVSVEAAGPNILVDFQYIKNGSYTSHER